MKSDNIIYCSICTLPPEYCEFGPSLDKCKVWLIGKDKALYTKFYGSATDATSSKTTTSGGEEGTPDVSKLSINENEQQQKEETKPQNKKKVQSQKVTIKREARTKRKSTVSVYGLHFYGVDLKKAAKMFASKFACGSSVTKSNQGQDEIVVQGDVEYEIEELIIKSFPQVPEDMIQNISK